MSESEYFHRLYQFQMQQQAIINEEIRKYGRQRTFSHHSLPPLHSPHSAMPDIGPPSSSMMSPIQGGGGSPHDRGVPMHHNQAMGGPPSYTREESLTGLSEYGQTGAYQQQPPLPSFFNPDLENSGGMDDLDFANSGPARHPQHWRADYDAPAMH